MVIEGDEESLVEGEDWGAHTRNVLLPENHCKYWLAELGWGGGIGLVWLLGPFDFEIHKFIEILGNYLWWKSV